MDSSEAHYESWRRFGEELGRPFPRGLFASTFGMMNREIIPLWLGGEISRERIDELSDRKEEIYREVAADILAPLEGVLELVASLKAADFGLAVGSSGPRANVELVLRVLCVADDFDAMVTSEDVAQGKPDPEVFVKAAGKLSVPPRRCAVFEDSPQGVEAGRAAGAKVVAVTSTRPASALADADLVIDSLKDLDAACIRSLIDG